MESARCKAFLESIDCGSFKAAADKLGYTPSGVSQLVSALEKELELTLLFRTKKGVVPTEEGRQLLPVVRSFLKREQDLYVLASEMRGLTVGSITIAAYPSIATTWLPELVRVFQKNYPNIQINIRESIRDEIFAHLDKHEVDMGFLAYVEPMPYDWIPLSDDDMIAVVPENHRLAGASTYPVRECENDTFIMTSWGNDAEILDVFKRNNVSPTVKYTTYDTPVTLAMIQMGIGVSFVNELSASRWTDHLVKLPLEPRHRITFGIAVPSLEHLSSAARKFLDTAVQLLTRSEQQ